MKYLIKLNSCKITNFLNWLKLEFPMYKHFPISKFVSNDNVVRHMSKSILSPYSRVRGLQPSYLQSDVVPCNGHCKQQSGLASLGKDKVDTKGKDD